jgi:hypothetical protein
VTGARVADSMREVAAKLGIESGHTIRRGWKEPEMVRLKRTEDTTFSILTPRFSAYADSDKGRGPCSLAGRSSRSRS